MKMNKKFLIIDSRPYGLFSIFLHTIDNIKWAEDNNYIPVVRWGPGRRDSNHGRSGTIEYRNTKDPSVLDKNNFLTDSAPASYNNTPGMKHCQCLYWSKDGWNNSLNPWEYYFEPLNSYSVKDALAANHDVSDIFMAGELDYNMQNKFLIKNIHLYEPLLLWDLLGTPLEREHRESANRIILNNIKIKKEITNKINKFYNKFFKEDVLAVHVRGTDKKMEFPHKSLPLHAYLDMIEEKLTEKDSQIFVASDNNEAIAEIFKAFGRKRTIARPAVRMSKYNSSDPICLTSATGPEHGEECLIDCVLMSRCDRLICTDSTVAAAAAYFNPHSAITYLNRIYGS